MLASDRIELLRWLIRPKGAMVAIAEVYVDQSGTHDGSPVLCVGGCVFLRRRALEFTKKHCADLRVSGVPYFHAKECNPDPGNGVFRGMPKQKRIDIQKRLINRVREFSEFGFAATVNEPEFDRLFGKGTVAGTAYSFLLWMALCATRSWLDERKFSGSVTYTFEAGHKHQRHANSLMNAIFSEPELRSRYRYAKHAFSPKGQEPALQAADLLAWHWFNDFKRRERGLSPRADCRALVRGEVDRMIHFTPKMLADAAVQTPGSRLLKLLGRG